MPAKSYEKPFEKGGLYLIVTQENLIRQIADRESMNTDTVRQIFKSAEDVIFQCLSSTTPSENTIVKLLDGLSLECNYIPEKRIHTYDDIVCRPRIRARPRVTRYYNRKLNNQNNLKDINKKQLDWLGKLE